ncbi:MAG: diacylglycerol kinase family lipid kinase [Ignavibacteriales bacterium]|nr:diacylglycerol kinase family lipid kinase [Ignavibacteriales bacterium]
MEKTIRNIRVIINPAAGKDESMLPTINASMKEAGIKWHASITHEAGDAIRFAKAAISERMDALAVYGGDGTLMEAVSGLIGSEIPLIILPGGSANVMATELGIPADLREACALISQVPQTMRAIDVGQFDTRYFITAMSFGFGADLVKGANRESKNRMGIFSYFLSAAAAFRKSKRAIYHLVIDGQEHKVKGFTCLISNTGNLGFSRISYDKHIDVSDGFLDVVVVRKANLGLLKLMAVTLLKRERPHNVELVAHWQGRDIRVSSSPKQTVQCDGEMLNQSSFHITVIPGAINVLVPNKKGNSVE